MKTQTCLTRSWQGAFLVAVLSALAACAISGATLTPAPTEISATPAASLQAAEPQPASATPTLPAPSPTPTVSPIPPEALAAELEAIVEASLPPTPTPDTSGYLGPGFEGARVLTLTNTVDDRPLWAAFGYGLRGFDPQQNNFVAIYSHDETGWQKLGSQLLDIDYLDQTSVEQVQLEPQHVWLQVQGSSAVHNDVFYLLQFDGQRLGVAVSQWTSNPGRSRLEDLNHDGLPEVLLDTTDHYVFCYACGVRFIQYQVLHWDGAQLSEVHLSSLPDSAPAELRELNNQAVALAEARLLPEAQATIKQAQALDEQIPAVTWNAALIDLLLKDQSEQAQLGPYPLLENIFYGNYEASLELMRAYRPEEIFSHPTPLISGTAAEGFEQTLSERLLELTNRAIELKPELAAAYFLRGWARFLTDPTSPELLADVQRAAELDPQEPLFSQSLEYLK